MAIRLNAEADTIARTANVPSESAFTMCGWFNISTDRNAISTMMCIDTGAPGNLVAYSTDTDGVSVKVFGSTASATIATAVVGTPFFGAMTGSGTTLTGYYRTASQNTLASQTATSVSFSQTTLRVGADDTSGEWFDGRVWNVKCWDRVLTAAELLVESYYRRVMFPSSINFHWPFDNSADTNDYGGNARAPTVGGSLTTEDGSFGLWGPRRRVFFPAAAAAGSAFSPMPLPRLVRVFE